MQQQASSKRRWWRARNFVCVCVLLAIGASVFCCQDWLFLTSDLRQMQGEWKVVRIVDPDGEEGKPQGHSVSIVGHKFTHYPPDSSWLDARAGRFAIYDPDDNERSLLGVTLRVPIWLLRPNVGVYGTYLLTDREMTLFVQGRGDPRREEEQPTRKGTVYLRRE
jgi:hypothetical protein